MNLLIRLANFNWKLEIWSRPGAFLAGSAERIVRTEEGVEIGKELGISGKLLKKKIISLSLGEKEVSRDITF